MLCDDDSRGPACPLSRPGTIRLWILDSRGATPLVQPHHTDRQPRIQADATLEGIAPVAYTTSMTWQYILFVTLTLLITAFVGYGAYTTARLLRQWQPEVNILLLPAENALRALVLVVCILLGRGSGLPAETLGWRFHNAGFQLLIGLLTGLGLALLFFTLGQLVTRFAPTSFYRPILALVLPRSRKEAFVLPFALILSVLFEEVLFRSLLVGGLSPLLPTGWLIVGFSLVFGLLHSPQGLWGILGAGAAGPFSGYCSFGSRACWHRLWPISSPMPFRSGWAAGRSCAFHRRERPCESSECLAREGNRSCRQERWAHSTEREVSW